MTLEQTGVLMSVQLLAQRSRLIVPLHEPAGWVAAPAGSSGQSGKPGPGTPVQPGSSLSTVLLSGDMLLAATGTVTWVDRDSVLAFGHPFLSMGPIEMPMAQAQVLAVLASLHFGVLSQHLANQPGRDWSSSVYTQAYERVLALFVAGYASPA